MTPRIEGFEISAPLGSGAMSAVWQARDLESGLPVALKIVHPHVAASPSALERFLHEDDDWQFRHADLGTLEVADELVTEFADQEHSLACDLLPNGRCSTSTRGQA